MTVPTYSCGVPLSAPAPPEAQLLVSNALHLMTHYSAQAAAGGGGQLASVIERHLMALASHGELNAVLRATCRQLAQQWAAVVDQPTPAPSPSPLRRSLLDRLVGRAPAPDD